MSELYKSQLCFALTSHTPSPQPLSPIGRGAKENTSNRLILSSLAPLPHLGGGVGGEGILRKENHT